MILWPLVALVGFLALTAFVIAMGTRSTARYEAERQVAADVSAAPAEVVTAAAQAA